jgi:hypothetical protein
VTSGSRASRATARPSGSRSRSRPDVAFRAGTDTARVYAAGPSAAGGRRFTRIARLPFSAARREGLAAWAATALRDTIAITVELPPGRASKPRTTRIAYAIDRLAKTRFADGALEDRRRLIALGQDPRESWH